MTQEGVTPAGPVRIELATSELEGGRYRAWADPARVLTVVAVSTPEDTFEKMVEPRLRELEFADENEDDPGGAPPAVRGLLGKLREAHGRLWRENRSLMREARSVELSCVIAEEDRVYFVKGAPAWACLLREGRAHPAGRPPDARESCSAALGRSERLGFEVTSMAVRPGDTVVVFASESDLPPDLRAVENLFARTPELKRACDGLVNLLGLQAQGACAVALRFVPVAAGPGRLLPNPLDDLAGEWSPETIEGQDLCSSPAATSAGPGRAGIPTGALPSGVGTSPDLAAGEGRDDLDFPGLDEAFAAMERHPVARPAEEHPAERPGSEELVPAGVGYHAADEEAIPVGAGLHPDSEELPRPRLNRTAWVGILGTLFVVLVALVALPRATGPGHRTTDWMEQAWRGGNGATAIGVLVVVPEPPARAVFVDGRQVAAETPARVDSVSAGRRRVTLDLGPCGTWEGEFTVRAGQSLRVAPRLTGSVSIVASDPSARGLVWVQGREKVSVPAVLDSLPAGWNRIFYEDERIPMWDRVVLVKPGQGAHVVVPNDYRGGQGAVRVEALRPRGNEGLVESEGDTVCVDGRWVGTTPLDLPLVPGLHSVRVGQAGPGAHVEVLEVKAGGVRSVVAQLGSGESPVLSHVAPGRILVRGPILLTVVVTGAADGWGAPMLHLPDLSPGSREIPMMPLDGTDGGFVGVVSPESVPLGRQLQYYFTVNGPDARTVWSDLYRLFPEAQWAGGAAVAVPRRADPALPLSAQPPSGGPPVPETRLPTEDVHTP